MKFPQYAITGIFLLSFLITPQAFASYCGDGALNSEGGEQCDDGNFINRDGCSAYCEIEDMDAPSVASVSIPDGATGIATTENRITLVFSEAMDPESIDDFRVQLLSAGDPFDVELVMQNDNKTLVILVNEELKSESTHAIRVRFAKDASGNEIEEFYSNFMTAVAIDDDAPNVVVRPAGGTYNLPQSVEIKAYD